MALLNRKRSWIVKALVLASVVWFMVVIVFLSESVNIPYITQKPATHSATTKLVPPQLPQIPIKRGNYPKLPDLIPGAGEGGAPYVIPAESKDKLADIVKQGWNDHAFNQYVSDVIGLHRTVKDERDEWCKEPGRFLETLPTTSVIIIYHNEAWSSLLRTVHSVIEHSPAHLLKEIILVDDCSTKDYLQEPLDDYLSDYPVVKLVRLPERQGLILARLKGSAIAEGEVLTFLDSHCECAEGWLEPLLDRIARDPTTVVCPVIDTIDDETLQYRFARSEGINVGTFDWNMLFHWMAIPKRELERRAGKSEPIRSPTMAGGLFSIDKAFFKRLGQYDDGFQIWGAENLELSFKTWMCGGTLEILPCSHVGHIFRKRSPYSWGSSGDVLRKNAIRLAKVWLDEYENYYMSRAGDIEHVDFGNIASRLELRQRLNCKSFHWYLENVIPEMKPRGKVIGQGEVRNAGLSGKFCLDMLPRGPEVSVYPCHKMGGNQFFMFMSTGELNRDDYCVDFDGQRVAVYKCHGNNGNQEWEYRDRQFKKVGTSKCLAIASDQKKNLVMEPCDSSKTTQLWDINKF